MRVDCGEGEQSIVSGSFKDTAVDSTGHKYSLPSMLNSDMVPVTYSGQ